MTRTKLVAKWKTFPLPPSKAAVRAQLKRKQKQKAKDEVKSQKSKKQSSKQKTQVSSSHAKVDPFVPNSTTYKVSVRGGIPLSKHLMYSDVQNNNNKFYIVQVLENATPMQFTSQSIFTRWGRVGEDGQFKLRICANSQNGKPEFDEVIRKKKNKGYKEVQVALVENQEQKVSQNEKKSKLKPQLQKLMELIFDRKNIANALEEMGYDAQKLPLGRLTEHSITEGFTVLSQIEKELEKKKRTKLHELSSEFYTCIPHNFGRKNMANFVIDSKDKLKEKLESLEAIKLMSVADKIIEKGAKAKKENYRDVGYRELKCRINPLDPKTSIYKLIQDYFNKTNDKSHYYKLQEIFQVEREGEHTRFNRGMGKVGNKMLLWHGSRVSNFGGILSQGLRIAPPEAPVCGYMLGKGIYFSDVAGLSLCFCHPKIGKSDILILLNEVALGNQNRKPNYDTGAANLPKGKHSTWGVGTNAPPKKSYVKFENEIDVPCGKPVEQKGGNLGYNEFVVYDTSQVRMRFLLRCSMKY